MSPARARPPRDVPRVDFPCLLALVRQLWSIEGMGHTHQLWQERRKIALTTGAHRLQWCSERVPYLHWLEEGNKGLPWLLMLPGFRHGAGKCCSCLCLLTLPREVEMAVITCTHLPMRRAGECCILARPQYSAVTAHPSALARQQETSHSKLARLS